MSLGRREARHETVAAARVASVTPEDYWDFKPGQKVMTADGFPGVVASVDDGPFAGGETYEVTLDNGMGGGQYTASLLRAMPQSTANVEHKTAADDYPELGTILLDRPPLALSTKASLTVQAWDKDEWDENDDEPRCTNCGSTDHEASDHPDEKKTANLAKHAASTYTHNGERHCTRTNLPSKLCDCHEYEDDADPSYYIKHLSELHVPHPDEPGHAEAVDKRDRSYNSWKYEASKGQDVADAYKRDEYSCKECGSDKHQTGDCPDLHKESAYNEGDPAKYTSEHKCPNCASDSALESADGMIKCESCGYEQQNGQKDGWSKTSSEITNKPGMGATCIKCGYGHRDAKGGDSCLLCDGQMSKMPEKHVASLLEDPYRLLIVAGLDPEFRFHVTASFADVRSKAKRLRAEGNVNIISVGSGTIVANVKGDHHVYETEIVSNPGSRNVAQWHCGCKWGAYAWGRTGSYKRFEGRLCSHALALHFEAQSQGMYGGTVTEQTQAPGWLKPRTRVVTEFDRDDRKNVSRPAKPRQRDLRSYSMVQTEESPVTTLVRTALKDSVSQEEILVSLSAAGIDARPFFSLAKEIGSDQDKAKHRHKGDQTPCARAGCGHPDGIHGDNGGTCLSPGCDCRSYTTTPSQAGAGEGKEKKEAHKVRRQGGEHALVRNWGLGGYGYGAGYFPSYGLDTDMDMDDDGDADDNGSGVSGASGGSGGDGGGMSSTGSLPDNMDPTLTPGNDVRSHDGSHGAWGATSPPDKGANPSSVGWASGADPKEFDIAHNEGAGRMGSLKAWPRIQTQAIPWGPVKDLAHTVGDAVNPVSQINDLTKAIPNSVPGKGVVRDLTGLTSYDNVSNAISHGHAPGLGDSANLAISAIPGGGELGGAARGLEKVVPKVAPLVEKGLGKAAPEIEHGIGDVAKGAEHGIGDAAKTVEKDAEGAGKKVLKGVEKGFTLPSIPSSTPPDYYRESNALISGHGIGSQGSLDVMALLAQEAALDAAEATMNEEPEAALPSTDGERDDMDSKDSEDMGATASLGTSEEVDDIVACFQATAGANALMSGSSAGAAEESDVASAAKAFLQTQAMKSFSPAEQKSIIDEGMDVTASNLDRLDIKDTHYAALEAALATADATDDDGDIWS